MAQIDILTKLFEDAEREFSSSIQAIIVRAYEEGYGHGLSEGRKIGMADYHHRLMQHVTASDVSTHDDFAFGDTVEAEIVSSQARLAESLAAQATGRTQYGLVEKLVLTVLRDTPSQGLTGKQIAGRIHQLGHFTVKEPSVRGTLRKLLEQGKVTKGVGKLWRLQPEYDL